MPVTVIENNDIIEVFSAEDVIEIVSADEDVIEVNTFTLDGPPYAGPYVVTPTRSQQILPASGFVMTSDVVVEPIPSNYGLISWNGAVLTVS